MDSLPPALKKSRCIIHIDLDCFYCQVEQVRLNIPFDVPCAVQQWHGLIAVNYAARKAGVKKMTNIKDATEICPEIRLLHVATYSEHDSKPHYYEKPDRNTHKVSLDAYREASRKIFKIFNSYCDTIQKIGLDEAFMDVTTTVNRRLIEKYEHRPEWLESQEEETIGIMIDWDKLGNTIESDEEKKKKKIGEYHWNPTTWRDLQLSVGAELANEIREKVYKELKYSCSGGIAHYKVVAKLCSNERKPNNQSILRESARLDYMRTVPFNKIRSMGGKLGSEIGEYLDIVNASELWPYGLEDLQRKFGESNGLYIYNICRGLDDAEVSPTKAPKSIGANKTFIKAITTKNEMKRWFVILSVELQSRIIQNYEEFKTWPKSILFKYNTLNSRSYKTKPLGWFSRKDLETHKILCEKFEKAFDMLEQQGYPCIGIDLVATGLFLDDSRNTPTLQQFFNNKPKEEEKEKIPPVHHNKPISANLDKAETIPNEGTNKPATIKELIASSHHTNKQTVDPVEPKETLTKPKNLFFKNHKPKEKTPDILPETLPETYFCEECHQNISIFEQIEHSDFHFAVEMQRQVNREQHRQRQEQPPPKKKVNKITNFFTPKPSP